MVSTNDAQQLTALRHSVMMNDPASLDQALTKLGKAKAKELVTAGAIEAGNDSYIPSLMGTAATYNYVAVAQVLKKHGADVNANIATAKYSMTALHLAESMGNKEFAQFLVNSGAQRNAKNYDGKTPAQVRNQPELAESRRALSKMKTAMGTASPVPTDELDAMLHFEGVHVKKVGKSNNFRISVENDNPNTPNISFIDKALHAYLDKSGDKVTHVERSRGGNAININGVSDKILRGHLNDARNDELHTARTGHKPSQGR